MLELQARIGGAWPERPRPGGLVADNTDAACVTIHGAWTSSNYEPGFVGTNYLHDGNTGKGQKWVSFRPSLPKAGSYEVFLRWTSSQNRATNTPVTLITRSNAPPVQLVVNQQVNGGRWNSLGTFEFDPATAEVIVANSNATGYVIADAVQFVDTSAVATNSDRDGDGLPDWWERWYFLSEISAEASTDTDGDGMNNYREYLTGTDPIDPRSRFDVHLMLDSLPGQAVLSWPSASNHVYRIEVSDDTAAFRLYRGGIPASPPQNTQTVSTTGEAQFFRVVAE